MRTILLILVVLLILSGCSYMPGAARRPGADALTGTWVLVSPEIPGYNEIKMLTASRFVWLTYDSETGMLVASGGGTYVLTGTEYIERLEFGTEPFILDIIGEGQVFRAELDNDQWYHTGTLTNGARVDERWKRLE
jgi:hypothetical protein